jgi:hypothetical protein
MLAYDTAADLLPSASRAGSAYVDRKRGGFLTALATYDSDRGATRGLEADGTVTISTAQLSYLLSGIDWRMPQETWRPTAVG